MICPNYKNKQVFDEFNELVTALGGQPLSEQEFQDVLLRKQRTGIDFAAMDAAYNVWNLNNGNAIDHTPNGENSVLFQSLLANFNGDRALAIKVKANTYSKNFRNWFGDWLSEDKTNVSRVVDENGEPLVVYRGERSQHDVKKEGYNFFSSDIEYAENYGDTDPYFLNIKNPLDRRLEYHSDGSATLIKSGIKTKRPHSFEINIRNLEVFEYFGHFKNHDGVIGHDSPNTNYGIEKEISDGFEYVTLNPNQIKSINNNGNFSKFDANIYHATVPEQLSLSPVKKFDPFVGISSDIMLKLQNGEIVNSRDIIAALIQSSLFDESGLGEFALVLSSHDIPVKMVKSNSPILMSTVRYKGKSVILINQTYLDKVSNNMVAETILHEMVHAITSDAIENPKTDAEKEFASRSHSAYESAKRAVKKIDIPNRFEHAFENTNEFAAYLATDAQFRKFLYQQSNKSLAQKIKNFINSLTKLLLGNRIFNTQKEQLESYRSAVELYISGVPVNTTPLTGEQIKAIYDDVSRDGIMMDTYLTNSMLLAREMGYSIDHATLSGMSFLRTQRQDLEMITLLNCCNGILRILEQQERALLHSILPKHDRSARQLVTKNAIDAFKNSRISKYNAIILLVSSTAPKIATDLNNFMDMLDSGVILNSSEIAFHIHDNISSYNEIFLQIQKLLTPANDGAVGIEELRRESLLLNEILPTEQVKMLSKQVDGVISKISKSMTALELMREVSVRKKLALVSEDVGYEPLVEFFDNCVIGKMQAEDVSGFAKALGSADSSTNPLIRTLDYLIRDADRKTDDAAYDKAAELITLQSNLGKKESTFMCYELDENEEPTGYLVRDRNYGRFYKNYNKFLKKVNNDLNNLYGCSIPEDTVITPDRIYFENSDEIENAVRQQLHRLDESGKLFEIWQTLPNEDRIHYHWYTLKNYWLGENCERRYTVNYYQSWATLSFEVQEQLQAIQIQISEITNKDGVRDENGFVRRERLTEEERRKLDQLKVQKRQLGSEVDEFGVRKSGEALAWAKQIQLHYSLLYTGKVPNKNVDEWRKARIAVIKLCGGQEAFTKWENGEENHGFNVTEFKKWDDLNSSLEFTTDPLGNWEILNAIEAEISGTYDFGEEYNILNARLQELLRPYRMDDNIRARLMPRATHKIIQSLVDQMDAIKAQHRGKRSYKAYVESKRKAYAKYVDFVFSKDFIAAKRELFKLLGEERLDEIIEEDAIDELLGTHFGKITGYNDDDSPRVRWGREWTVMRAKKKYRARFMQVVPSSDWIDFNTENSNINENFDEAAGSHWVPKKQDAQGRTLYDNTKAFEKVNKEGSAIKAYYDAIRATIKLSNEMQTSRQYADNYLLPQVMQTTLENMLHFSKQESKLGLLWYHLRKKIGYTEEDDDAQKYGQLAGFKLDEQGNAYDKKDYSSYGVRPDGKRFAVVPLSFTAKMEKPELISRELTMITMMYYTMSCNFKHKNEIKDDCENIVDMLGLKQTEYRDSQGKTVVGQQSNTFQMATNTLTYNLYGQDIAQIKRGKQDWTKVIGLISKYTTVKNLGVNPKVALQGLLSSLFAQASSAAAGEAYTFHSHRKAAHEVLLLISKSMLHGGDVSNSLTNNKLAALHEFFNLADALRKKYSFTNRTINGGASRFLQALNANSAFGFMTTCDFASKSLSMVTDLMEYRFVDGEFITNDNINRHMADGGRHNNRALQEAYVKEMTAKWKKAPTLYDALNVVEVVENGVKVTKIVVDDRFKEAFLKIQHDITTRVQNDAERADGMALKTQKTMFAHGWIGALCLIHRQYLPLMLQERFGDTVYDFNMKRFKNGQFKHLYNYVKNIATEHRIAGIALGASLGHLMLPGLGTAVGAAVMYNASRKLGNKWYQGWLKGLNPFSMKKTSDNFLYDTTDENVRIAQEKTQISWHRIYAMRRTLFELVALTMSNLLVGAINAWSDDDDDKFKDFVSLVATGSLWECMGPYNLLDIINAFKNPTAALGSVDQITEIGNHAFDLFGGVFFGAAGWFDNGSWLPAFLDTIGSLISGEDPENLSKESILGEVNERSVPYGGLPKWTRSLIKLFPAHNLYEQFLDSKSKRRYQINLMFHKELPTTLHELFNPQPTAELLLKLEQYPKFEIPEYYEPDEDFENLYEEY